MSHQNLEKGILVIKNIVKKIPNSSGVYKMISKDNEILYVGKAKVLSKRIASYSNPMKLNSRLQKMISLVRNIEFIVTNDEANALLLESSLIKETKPKLLSLILDRSSFEEFVKLSPLRRTEPDVGLSRVARICSNVDFPAPDLPVIAILSPFSITRSILLRTLISSSPIKKDLHNLRHSNLFMS